ncbi:MAG: class I tRNA ligase family protein [Candidatus Pacebacteria bacterium]|nr:class I tRNA ligase family protein [Candidatus Paceibacterota bacterium]
MSKKINRENDTVEVVAEVVKSEVALREEEVQAFWQREDIFNKSMERPAGAEPKGEYIFYDGPPFATGLPHYGHILAGTIKDAIPRFWTMNGFRVKRRWGWDCHGLPLENLIEKKLGLANKKDIEDFGVKNFNEEARGAVLEYADDWKKIIPRLGRFVDMENDYRTMDSTYTESVWWVFKQLHEKGLVSEGYKAMHLCPRCGTTLSNFEVNLGYQDVKDIAVTVKMPLLDNEGKLTDTSILIWTTTPWTLPGNMAVAVNKDFEYVKVKIEKEEGLVILAKGRLAQLGDSKYEIVVTLKGSDLIDLSYQPPFDYLQKQNIEGVETAWKIYHADYVELGEEGTGAVHIAPAYGEEDMNLAKEHNIPIVHHVDYEGRFMPFVTEFAGQLVKPKDDDATGVSHLDADIKVLKHLQEQGKIFKKENITHSYPHCWRDGTPLLNYGTTSWFVNVPQIKDKLVEANNKVKWVPDHVGANRFGNWLEGARDWAISRQRYWGAPLPIWRNKKSGEIKVIGSLEELKKYVPNYDNQYYIMRHAEAESNITGLIDAIPDEKNPLTENGREQIKKILEELKEKGITKIVHSGMQRTRETAELLAEGLGLPKEMIVADSRLTELRVGETYEGKTWDEYNANYASEEEKFYKSISGTENRSDVIKRVGEWLFEFHNQHEHQRVLIVGHASSLFALRCVAEGATIERAIEIKKEGYLQNAEWQTLAFSPFPHNDNYELDYHRPYIDEIKLYDNGEELERVPDVFDCWFESGSMPYAQHHYPFSCADTFEKECFPAQFIAEGLDQTRGWFYSMLVLGVALFDKSPYENVVVNGTLLAEDGRKMSKSLNNYPDPMNVAHTLGADAMRFYLLSSPAVKGEDLNFTEKDVAEIQRKNLGRLHNVLAMYEMFQDGGEARHDSHNILDKWIVARLNALVTETTNGYQNYELDKATRPITDFIDDLSVWYLRRSRERLKGEDEADKKLALSTLRYVLKTLAQVMAPAMPFYADYLWQKVREENDAVSVHLSRWPTSGGVDFVVIGEMSLVREFVTTALEARTKANVKVRQPLASLTLNIEMVKEYNDILAEEINVKKVMFDISQTNRVVIDTILTPELKMEGDTRDLIRAIQDMRKEAGLIPQDVIKLEIETDQTGEELLNNIAMADMIKKTVGASDILITKTIGKEIKAGENSFTVSIHKL